MTRNKLRLRNEANVAKYINHDDQACTDAVMELYNRMPDIGGAFKYLYRYRKLDKYEIEALENESIFMRWPSSFSDEEDCKPVFDLKEIGRFIVNTKYPRLQADNLYEHFSIKDAIESEARFKDKIIQMRNMWMISCFTEHYDNIHMWNEYADKEKGICLAYGFMDVLKTILKYGASI